MAGLTGAVGGPVGIVNIVMVECCVIMPGLLRHTLGRQLSTLSARKRQAVYWGRSRSLQYPAQFLSRVH